MAAVSQYYSDNQRSEVLKGLNEKAEQGWLPSNAPFGYDNDTKDRNEPIKPNPTEATAVRRIFEQILRAGHHRRAAHAQTERRVNASYIETVEAAFNLTQRRRNVAHFKLAGKTPTSRNLQFEMRVGRRKSNDYME